MQCLHSRHLGQRAMRADCARFSESAAQRSWLMLCHDFMAQAVSRINVPLEGLQPRQRGECARNMLLCDHNACEQAQSDALPSAERGAPPAAAHQQQRKPPLAVPYQPECMGLSTSGESSVETWMAHRQMATSACCGSVCSRLLFSYARTFVVDSAGCIACTATVKVCGCSCIKSTAASATTSSHVAHATSQSLYAH